jgi:outer membrane lipoprotein-sorting protein
MIPTLNRKKIKITYNRREQMKKSTLLTLVTVALGVVVLGGVVYAADLTGDQILDKMIDHQDETMSGSLIMTMKLENVYSDGTSGENVFSAMAKRSTDPSVPDKSLMYYKEPEDVRGTIFLAISPDEGDSRMWLYLPALGSAKELVSEEQEQSFAGSTFSYKDIGSASSMQDDYNAELIGEEAVTVEGKSYACYVLKLTAKPDADVDYPTQKLWVSKDFWTSLKGESYNEDGKLEITMEVVKLGEFEGNVVADEMFSKNVIEGNSTRMIFLERKRPASEFPDSVFDADNLTTFDPAAYGL